MPASLTVVGIGADGWAGLSRTSAAALTAAEVVMGSSRQLGLLPAAVTATRVARPSPLLPALPGLLAEHRDRRVGVLALFAAPMTAHAIAATAEAGALAGAAATGAGGSGRATAGTGSPRWPAPPRRCPI